METVQRSQTLASEEWRQLDERHIWHPFTQHRLIPTFIPVLKGQGAQLVLEGGETVLDAMSSWWVNIHGHSHPRIAEAIYRQALELEHVIFAGFTHRPAVALASSLVQHPFLKKSELCRVFFSDNGSTAVEVALKMAFQFHQNQGRSERVRFIALRGAYHGDTLGAMSVGEPEGFHQVFQRLMPEVDFVSAGDLAELQALLVSRPETHAGFIFEPMVQGAAGMKFVDPEYLREAVALCRKHGVLSIADEVFTGFYRTGKCFAMEHVGIGPDLLCLSKGITGGFLPLAVTVATDPIFQAFQSDQVEKAFLHGHSYTANPLACAAAIASWDLLHAEETQRQIAKISQWTSEEIQKLREDPSVRPWIMHARSCGTIGAIEIKQERSYYGARPRLILKEAIRRGVLIRPLGNVLYALPPYCVSEEEIRKIYQTMGELVVWNQRQIEEGS